MTREEARSDPRLGLISELAAGLVEVADVNGVCAGALDVFDRLLGWRRGIVLLRPGEQDRLIRVHSRNIPDEIAPVLQELPIDDSTQIGLTALRREAIVVPIASYDYPRLRDHVSNLGDGTLVTIPLVAHDQLVGVLANIAEPDSHPVTDWLRASFGTLSRLMGLALASARLFDQVVRANDHIRRVNKELEDFTYVVSHDLKEPLRTIQSFCSILAADYGQSFDDAGRELLAAVISSSDRLRRLIDDLLTLSRIGRKLGPLVDIDMAALAERAARFLDASVARAGAEIRVERPLPQARGDVNLVELLVANLLSNAIKFNQGRPVVEVGALPMRSGERGGRERSRPQVHTYFVRDNGIGIRPEHHESIFGVFKRLHPRAAYEGTGAGLTIARRIIEAHGGRIWVESAEGQGATFLFTLPAAVGGETP